jgi:hypothetical protein
VESEAIYQPLYVVITPEGDV